MSTRSRGEATVKWVMAIGGLLTCTMIYPAIAPGPALLGMYGEPVALNNVTEIVVRNWAMLITLVGVALVYGAFHPGARGLALGLGMASKLAFIGLTLWLGLRFIDQQVGIALAIDALLVVLFGFFLAAGVGRTAK